MTTAWDNGIMPHVSTPQKPSQTPRKCASGKIRNRWSRHNHWFNPIKSNRYNILNANLTDMNKINIVQPVPKRACECFGVTCSYCMYEAPHPSPIPLDWSSEDWESEKTKAREQKSLIDFDPPKLDLRQTTDLETVNNLPIQNVSIYEDKKEEELPEVTVALVLPPEVLAATPVTEVTKQENIAEEEDNRGLTDQQKILQKEEEEYAIYVSMLSEEEESDTKPDTDESLYFF